MCAVVCPDLPHVRGWLAIPKAKLGKCLHQKQCKIVASDEHDKCQAHACFQGDPQKESRHTPEYPCHPSPANSNNLPVVEGMTPAQVEGQIQCLHNPSECPFDTSKFSKHGRCSQARQGCPSQPPRGCHHHQCIAATLSETEGIRGLPGCHPFVPQCCHQQCTAEAKMATIVYTEYSESYPSYGSTRLQTSPDRLDLWIVSLHDKEIQGISYTFFNYPGKNATSGNHMHSQDAKTCKENQNHKYG